MKPVHIIALVVVAVLIGIIITTFSGSGTYSHFAESAAHPGKEFHIIGTLNRAKPIEYDSRIDHNLFSFYMIDQRGRECLVIHRGAKPQDFEKSDQVVTIGYMEGNQFVATSLLLKCPSKYNENGIPQEYGDTLM